MFPTRLLQVFVVLIILLTLVVPAVSAGSVEPPERDSSESILSGSASSRGIVASIFKAPIIPDGTTAGAATDFVITLDSSLDPDVPGRTLLAGNSIRITLPPDFVYVDRVNFPIGTPGESPTCAPGNFQCSGGVLLQGWPQHPIAPPFLKYSISYDASTNTIAFTALEDLVPAPPLEPGIKQMHLLLLGFRNPGPGEYGVRVEAETGPNGAVERGWGTVRIFPSSRPSINVTSAFNAGTPNTIYQTTGPGQMTPLPYDFLLWDAGDVPFVDVEVQNVSPTHSILVKDGQTVGDIFIKAPGRVMDHQVVPMGASVPVNAPVLGAPTARLTVGFMAGSNPGLYQLTFKLNGGNSVQMFVDVE